LARLAGVLRLAVGEALGTPVLLAATRVYSTTAQRSMAFSIIYALMNVGYLIAGYVFDFIRSLDLHLTIGNFQPTPHQQLFALSLALEILLFPTIYFLRRDVERSSAAQLNTARSGFWSDIARTAQKGATDTIRLFHRLISQSAFYRLLVFFLFVGFLKAIFLQLDYVFPKFGDREMGLHAPVGKLAGINAILIIILAPVIGGALGHGYLRLTGTIHPYYIMSALYLTVFSVGEAFYSPRVYEYAASIAPPGQEASYGALAYIPFLVGKLLIGTSGWVLAAFCPEHGECRPAMMWLIFALAASMAPVGLLVFRRYIQVPEAGRSD